MWNDGPAKQPWLNYFNEYELQHCCFGGDGGNGDGGEGYTDEAFSTSRQGTASAATSAAQSAASAADSQTGQNTAGGVGIDDDPDSLTADQAAAAAAAADAAAAAGLGGEAQQAAADAVAAEEMGIDIGDVAGGLAGANVSMQEIDALEDLGLIGYNERTDLGYFGKLDADVKANAEAKAAQVQADLRSRPGLEDEVVSINPVTGDFEYSSFTGGLLGGGQGLVDLYSEFSPGAIAMDAGRGFYDMLTGLPGVVADIGTDLRNEVADIFGVSPSEVTQEQVNAVTSGVGPDAGIGEFSPSAAQTATALGTSPAQTAVTTGLAPDDISYAFAAQPGRDLAPDDIGMAYSKEPGRDLAPDDIGMAYSKEPGRDLDPSDLSYAFAAEPGRGLDPSDLSYAFAAQPSEAYSLGGYSLAPKTETEADRRNDLIEGLKASGLSNIQNQPNVLNTIKSTTSKSDLETLREIGRRQREALSNIRNRKVGGSVKKERKSAIDKFFAKVSAPSAYSQEPTPVYSSYVTALPPEVITEDLFSTVSRERREAAGQTPVFNYERSKPYSKKLYAASYGLDPATIENVMPTISSTNPMLDALRKNLQERRDKENEEEEETTDPIVEDDDNYSMYDEEAEDFGGIGSIGDDVDPHSDFSDMMDEETAGFMAGGGGIRDVLYRQTGGAANFQYRPTIDYYPDPRDRRSEPEPLWPGPTMPGHPDYPGTIMPPFPPFPPFPPYPEPKPEPPPPPPEPKIIYDPVREEAARKRARELQAIKIGKLDTAPQTRAEREALQASGGFYRDEEGQVRDAQGNLQEDFGFDYVAPPPPDPYDPPNTPDTPPPVVPDDPTDPIPLPDPTDPIPLPDDPIISLPRPVYPMPYPFPDKPITYPDRPGVVYPYDPSQPFQPSGPDGGPMMGQQLQPTGLQGLQQGMQGFGMQSPRPFGTQQPFSSGFGGFGQQQGYYR